MKGVDTIARVRREHLVRGRSIREIARELHISRNTVRKILRSGETEFVYERTVQPQPKLGSDHEGALLFLRGATPHGGLFDLTRGIFVDRQAVLGGGYEAGSACGAQHDGRLVALHEDGGLNGAHRR